jgi:drug/metabolite transporter (DMT)-like permease
MGVVENLRRRGILAALSSAFFLGLTPIFGKQAILFGFSPLAVVALRTALASLLLLLLMEFFHRPYFYIYPAGLLGCLLAGGVNGVGSILYYNALVRLDAGMGQILYSFYPLFLALWLLLDHQKLTLLTILRLAMAIPAVYLLVNTGRTPPDLLGVALMLGAALLFALHLLVNQRVLYDMPAPTVTLYTLLAMCAIVIPAYLLLDRRLPVSAVPWWPVAGLGLITFLSRLALFMGVKHLGGMQTSLLGMAETFVSVLLAYLWLGERLAGLQWAGALLLAASLLLAGLDRSAPDKSHSSNLLAWLRPPEVRAGLPWNSRH